MLSFEIGAIKEDEVLLASRVYEEVFGIQEERYNVDDLFRNHKHCQEIVSTLINKAISICEEVDKEKSDIFWNGEDGVVWTFRFQISKSGENRVHSNVGTSKTLEAEFPEVRESKEMMELAALVSEICAEVAAPFVLGGGKKYVRS